MYNDFRNPFWPSLLTGSFLMSLLPLLIIEICLKGYALWKAAKNNQSGWFIALLVLNTLGILPIIYLAFCQVKIKEATAPAIIPKTTTVTKVTKRKTKK